MSDDVKAAVERFRAWEFDGLDAKDHQVILARLDGEPGRLAAAREEQREADARRLEAFFIGNERMTRAEAMQMQAAANIVRQGPPHDSTPLADEIRTLRADLDVAESRKSQAIHDLHARAEKAEARVRELEAESSTWAKACGEEMRKRQSMEANWENMAANNREFCARAAKAESERDEARAELTHERANGPTVEEWRRVTAERDELRQRIHDACPSPDEGGRIHAGSRIVCGQCHDSEVRHLTNERDEARAQVRILIGIREDRDEAVAALRELESVCVEVAAWSEQRIEWDHPTRVAARAVLAKYKEET